MHRFLQDYSNFLRYDFAVTMQLLEEFYAPCHRVRHVRRDNLKCTPFLSDRSLLKVYLYPSRTISPTECRMGQLETKNTAHALLGVVDKGNQFI